jgi:SEC-C motif
VTLIIVAANRQQTVIVADRAISRAGRSLGESNKAAILHCANARLGVSFTGLAGLNLTKTTLRGPAPPGVFRTGAFILDALHEASHSTTEARALIARFAQILAERIRPIGTPLMSKLLVVGFAGYEYHESASPSPLVCDVSNLREDGLTLSDEGFWVHPPPEPLGNVYMVVLGLRRALPEKDREALATMVEARKPARAIVDKAVEVIGHAAGSKAGSGSISRACNSLILPAEPNGQSTGTFHADGPTDTLYWPSVVEARGGVFGLSIMMDTTLKSGVGPSHGPVIGVPKVGRNTPCPCGSGIKYKRCHGR